METTTATAASTVAANAPQEQPKAEHNQLLRNMISALSFEPVFRRFHQHSDNDNNENKDIKQKNAGANHACQPGENDDNNESAGSVKDRDDLVDSYANGLYQRPVNDGMSQRDLVPPSSSRRWSRPPPSTATTFRGSSGSCSDSGSNIGMGTSLQAQRQSQQSPPARRASSIVHTHAHNLLHGTLDPDGGVEVVFYDCHEYGDGPNSNEFRPVDFRRDSVVMSSIKLVRGGGGDDHGGLDDSMHDDSTEINRCQTPGGSPQRQSPSLQLNALQLNAPQQTPHPNPEDVSESHSVASFSSSPSRRLSSFLPAVLGGPFTKSGGGESMLDSSKLPPPQCGSYPLPPPPPEELPLRFLRAGKGDIEEGLRRYQATLEWRRENSMDTILREPNPHFDLIKRHYPHFFAGRGRLGEPVFYEQPPKTNLKALREGGVTIDLLLRHVRVCRAVDWNRSCPSSILTPFVSYLSARNIQYMMVTEFQWQYVERDDLQRSIYIIDLDGIRFGDFVGEVVDFVKRASSLSAQHYPERAGYVFVINVPAWFKVIFAVIKPLIDESTLEKIYILRGANEIRQNMLERIPIESIPAEYGGQGPPLGQSEQENDFRALVEHNNALARGEIPKTCPGDGVTGSGRHRVCHFCAWQQPRSY
jgi:hypothetical protein